MRYFVMLLAIVLSGYALGPDDEFDTGVGSLDRGAYTEAVTSFTRVIESGQLSRENLARAYNNRAVAYDRLGRHAQARSDYDQALSLQPSNFVTVRNKGLSDKLASLRLVSEASAAQTDGEFPTVMEKRGLLGL